MTQTAILPVQAWRKVCSAAAQTSAQFKLLEPGDRVLVALSGGADSFVMLEVLLELRKRVPFDFTLEAVSFDPGFPQLQIELIAEYCQQKQIRHTVVAMDMPQMFEQTPQTRYRRPCVWCSRMRRGKLYGLAREKNFNKLALGHHADDLLESFIMSLMRGQGLTTMAPNVPADTQHAENGSLRIIRPLAMCVESLVKKSAEFFEFPAVGDCPYQQELADSGDRARVKRMLAEWAQDIPDLRQLMLKSLKNVEAEYLLDQRYINY